MNWTQWTIDNILDISLGWLSFFAFLFAILIVGWLIEKAEKFKS